MAVFEYWKNRLNSREKHIYEAMVRGFREQCENIPCDDFPSDKTIKIYVDVARDHPEFFWLTNAPQVKQTVSVFETKTTLVARPIFNLSVINDYSAKLSQCRSRLISQLSDLPTKEKLRGICDEILNRVVYKVDNKFNQNAATVLVKGVGQCSGISRAVKLMCDWLGIRCMEVCGTAENSASGTYEPHAWNIVDEDGVAAHLDATFMMGANSSGCKPFRYLYFCVTDSEIAANHVWNKTTVPACDGKPAEPEKPKSAKRNFAGFFERVFLAEKGRTESAKPEKRATASDDKPTKTPPRTDNRTVGKPSDGTMKFPEVKTRGEMDCIVKAAITQRKQISFRISFFCGGRYKYEVMESCRRVFTELKRTVGVDIKTDDRNVVLTVK